MRFKFTYLLIISLFFSTFVFSQAFTENFEGAYPRTTHPVMTFSNNGVEVFNYNNTNYQLQWDLLSTFFPIIGTKSLILNTGVQSVGARASIIFNNVDLRNFLNAVLNFKSRNYSKNSVLKIALRKRNQWQYISEPFALRQATNDGHIVNNSIFLLEHMTSADLDSVDIMIEGVSDNSSFSYLLIDDISLTEATGTMQVGSVVANTTSNNIITSLDANVLEVKINTINQLNALDVTQFQFNTDVSNNLEGIDSAKLFYVNKDGQYLTDYIYQFGNTIINPNGAFVINGNQLLSRNNTAHSFILKLYFNKNAVVGSIVNFKCTSVNIGSTTHIPSATYNNKVVNEIIPVLHNANKSVVLSNNYRGLATAVNSYQRAVFVYDEYSDFGITTQNYDDDTIVGIQIKIATAPTVPITGQLKVYLKVGNLGTVTGDWATEVVKLQMVYDGQFTIPAKKGFYTIRFNKSNLPINNNVMYELAYEWVVSSGIATNLTYETFSTSSNSAFSSGNTTGLPSSLASTTFRPLLRFLMKEKINKEISPVYLPSIPSFNNVDVNNRYDLNYTIYSDKSQADSFNFSSAIRGVNSPSLTYYNKFVRVPAKSFVTIYNSTHNFNLIGYDTIYNGLSFVNDIYITNNKNTTLAFPFIPPTEFSNDYKIYNKKDQYAFANNRMFLNKYQVAKRNYVNSLILHIGKNSSAIGVTIRPVILDSSNNTIYTGDNYTISAKDINTFTLVPIKSFELNAGSFKIGLEYVQGDVNQKFLTFDNAMNINKDWSYVMNSSGRVIKMPSNIGLVIGFNSSAENKAVPQLGVDRNVCEGYVLNAGVNANKYLWNTGDTSFSIVVDSTGKYIVRIQHANSNNFYYDSVYLTVIKNVKPIAKFNPNNTFCLNDSIQLSLILNNHTANVRYKWYKNNTFIAETLSPDLDITNASNQDKYHVLLNYKLDCITDTLSFSDTIEIKIIPRLIDSVTILNTIDTICTDSIQLMVNSFDTNQLNYYTWMINGQVIDSTFTNSYTFRNIENNDTLVVLRNYLVGCFNSASVNSDTLIIKTKELFNFFEYTIDSTNKIFNFQSSSTNYNKLIWDFGDGSIDTSNNTLVSHQYLVDGTYKVSLIAQNDCTVDTSIISILVLFTGVNTENKTLVSIYPNPSNGEVFIKNINFNKKNSVKIYDVYGKYLAEKFIYENSFSISEYSEGVYFVHFENQIFRIIKLTNTSH